MDTEQFFNTENLIPYLGGTLDFERSNGEQIKLGIASLYLENGILFAHATWEGVIESGEWKKRDRVTYSRDFILRVENITELEVDSKGRATIRQNGKKKTLLQRPLRDGIALTAQEALFGS